MTHPSAWRVSRLNHGIVEWEWEREKVRAWKGGGQKTRENYANDTRELDAGDARETLQQFMRINWKVSSSQICMATHLLLWLCTLHIAANLLFLLAAIRIARIVRATRRSKKISCWHRIWIIWPGLGLRQPGHFCSSVFGLRASFNEFSMVMWIAMEIGMGTHIA